MMPNNSEAKIKANARYDAKAYEKILFRLRNDGTDGITKEMISNAAQDVGESLNQFIVKAIRDRITNGN